MKKLLISSLLLSSLLYGEAQVYMGVVGGLNSESFGKPYNKNIASPATKIQIGYGDIKEYSIQLGVIYDKNDKNVFATDGTNDKPKYSMDVELIKSFDFGWHIYPFLKAGLGAGVFNTSIDYTDSNSTAQHKSSLNFSSYNLGAGIYYPLSTHFNIEAGATYKGVSYQKIDTSSSEKGIGTKAIFSYLGIDYRF
jgi:opacity protein-like surface antigen